MEDDHVWNLVNNRINYLPTGERRISSGGRGKKHSWGWRVPLLGVPENPIDNGVPKFSEKSRIGET